jgi:hypothetical protein
MLFRDTPVHPAKRSGASEQSDHHDPLSRDARAVLEGRTAVGVQYLQGISLQGRSEREKCRDGGDQEDDAG